MNRRKGRARVVAGVAAALSAALLLGACGGGANRSAAPETPAQVSPSEASAEATEASDEVSPSEPASDEGPVGLVGDSQATYAVVENRLQDWWGGDGIPVTWRVSETQNRVWDGASRPDHAPPKGLQGLVQNADSGEYRVRMEVNTSYSGRKSFVLTPVASVDGEQVALSPITFEYRNDSNPEYEFDDRRGWELSSGGRVCNFDVPVKDQTQVQSFTYGTPRGELRYEVVLKCPLVWKGPAEVLVRNYQR